MDGAIDIAYKAMQCFVAIGRPFGHSTCKSLNSTEQVEACHPGCEEQLHKNTTCNGGKLALAFCLSVNRASDLVVIEWSRNFLEMLELGTSELSVFVDCLLKK